MKLPLRIALILSSFALFTACSKNFETSSDSSTATLPESEYCGSAQTISGGTFTVTGKAQFKSRKTSYGTSYSAGGSAMAGWYLDYTFNTNPIANAEVHIYDGGGNLIQCGETDGSGNFSLLIPDTVNSQYTLSVYSRAFNSTYKVSVLNDVNSNQPYKISTSFSSGSSSPVDAGTLTAEGDESVDSSLKGGAFNIMNDILKANNFLRLNATGFTVAPKVTVFWKAGFNPSTYIGGDAGSGLSFYSPGDYQLFILGGINGDVKTSDTDHFDDSVIMHEYGHFLEDVYGKSNSPGGSHNGDAVIDPRLAWSEGWANYIQSAIKTYVDSTDPSKSSYIDTYGYKANSGSTSGFGQNIVFDLTSDPLSTDSYDSPNVALEGMFREVSISRTLYKTTSPTTVTYTYNGTSGSPSIDIPFSYVWQVFSDGDSSSTPVIDGFHSDNIHFRNMGLFNYLLNAIITLHQTDDATTYGKLGSWATMTGQEKQATDNLEYGANLVSGTCSDTTLQAVRNLSTGRAIACAPISGTCTQYAYASNQLQSNDFYRYCFDGSSNPTLTLTTTQAGSTTLSMNIYKENYVYFEEIYSLVGQSSPYILQSASISTAGTRSVSLAGQPAGCYMVNIRASTTNADGTDKTTGQLTTAWKYHLSNDGGLLCPTAP